MRKFTLTAVLFAAALFLTVGQSMATETFNARIDWVDEENINNEVITLTVVTLSADFLTVYDEVEMVHNGDVGSTGHWKATFGANSSAARWKVTIESTDSEVTFMEEEIIDDENIVTGGLNELNADFHYNGP